LNNVVTEQVQPHYRLLDPSQIEQIHQAVLELLATTGVRVLHPEGVRLLRDAGCEVRGENRVLIPAHLVEASVRSAPSAITIYNRLGRPAMQLEGRNLHFGLGTDLLRTMPDDTVVELRPDNHTAILALTHDPKLDDLALMEALKSPAFYVGAIGSQRNQAKRKERLREFGVTPDQLARLHGPVGLKNGARTPPEIAVSILAEMTAVKYGYRIPPPEPIGAAAAVEAGCAT